jgi:hypothetical protein
MTHSPREGNSALDGATGGPAASAATTTRAGPPPRDLPLAEYLYALVLESIRRGASRHAASQTGRPAPWESPLWWFVRMAKGHDDLVGLDAPEAMATVRVVLAGVVDTRTGRTAPDPWWRWLGVVREDAEVEFLDVWPKVRYLPGATPLCNAMAEAESAPLTLAPEVAARRSKDYPRFVSLAGYLQAIMGGRAIYLPSREVLACGDYYSVTHMTVTRYVKWAVQDDYLRLVEKHTRERAARYVFGVEKFQALRERAEPSVVELWASTANG